MYSRRARALLREVLYGGRPRLDIARLQRLAAAFTSFTTDGLTRVGGSLAGQPQGALSNSLLPGAAGAQVQSGVGAGASGRSAPSPSPPPASSPAFVTAASFAGSQQLSPVSPAGAVSVARRADGTGMALVRAGGLPEEGGMDPAVREALLLVFSARGSYLQVGTLWGGCCVGWWKVQVEAEVAGGPGIAVM